MPWLSAERQDNDRCLRMESWEEHFNSGRTAFLSKEYKKANKALVRAASLNLKNPEIFLILGMSWAELGRIPEAVKCLNMSLDLDPLNCSTQFAARVMTHTLMDQFFQKMGKHLELFEDEIVYTTEKEIQIERGRTLDPSVFQRELDFFWKGFVQKKWDEVKASYEYSDMKIEERVKRIQNVMALNCMDVVCETRLKLRSHK